VTFHFIIPSRDVENHAMNDLQQADETVFGFPQWQSLTVTPSNKTKRKSETNQGPNPVTPDSHRSWKVRLLHPAHPPISSSFSFLTW
jgi:hypothetical protein